MHIFITGTDTHVGKTLISTWLCLHTRFSYYKPIQTGCAADSLETDRAWVSRYSGVRTFPEAWIRPLPAAPYVITQIDPLSSLKLADIALPCEENLIIEGAGGVLVPLNTKETLADLILHLGASVILVTRPDLGTLNHTLLSLEALRHRRIPVLGVIMNRPCTPEVAHAIQHHGHTSLLATFPRLPSISSTALKRIPLTEKLRDHLRPLPN